MTTTEEKKQFEQEVMEKYPHLYADMYKPATESCMHWGICVGKGWFDIIRRASEKIEAIILSLPEEERSKHKCAQIKEKFSILRWYVNGRNKQIEEIITAAEDESATICEECGKAGSLRNYGHWLLTRCDTCFESYLESRKPKI